MERWNAAWQATSVSAVQSVSLLGDPNQVVLKLCLHSSDWGPCLLQGVLESHIEALPGDPKKKSANNGEVVAKLHQVEKHIRKNKLKVGPALL